MGGWVGWRVRKAENKAKAQHSWGLGFAELGKKAYSKKEKVYSFEKEMKDTFFAVTQYIHNNHKHRQSHLLVLLHITKKHLDLVRLECIPLAKTNYDEGYAGLFNKLNEKLTNSVSTNTQRY